MSSLTCNVNGDGALRLLEQLDERAKQAVRPAAFDAAEVFYQEVLTRVPVKSGRLRSAIYRAYSENNSKTGEKATYHISWNARKAPHGHLIEFGTVRAAARPFIRPAYEAAKYIATQKAKQSFVERINGS